MPSTFAWLDHSENDRRKALDIVELFREQDTRDELGIGTVRDALADALFPGVSTIQTRAKYFLFIPWIYQTLESNRAKSSGASKLARRREIELITPLLESDDTDGVIGKLAAAGLQRLPSSVYWAGLGVLGIRRFQGSLDQYYRSLDGFYDGRRQVRASADDGIIELFKPQSNWHEGLPPAPEEFPTSASLELSREEAEYLRHQIMANVPGTFLAFLIDRGQWWDKVSFPWEHPQVSECRKQIQEQLHHAKCFSLTMWGAALFYNLMLAEKRVSDAAAASAEPQRLVARYRDSLGEWYDALSGRGASLDEWSAARPEFWVTVKKLNSRIPFPTEAFINRWIDLSLRADDIGALIGSLPARNLIQHRERQLKRNLARLDNPRALEMWGGAAGTQRPNYRWPQVQVIVKDILHGLGKGAR